MPRRFLLPHVAAAVVLAVPVLASGDPAPGKAAATASGEDCAVFVALGQALLGWGGTPPDPATFPIFYRPDGAGGYVPQCPWADLGVTPLPPGAPDPSHMSFFTPPKYSRHGRSVSVSFVVRTLTSGQAPLISQKDCRLSRVGKHWAFKGCVQAAET